MHRLSQRSKNDVEGLSRRSGARSVLRALVRGESGQDLIEYALLAGVIALFCVAAVMNLEVSVDDAIGVIATDLEENAGG